MFIEGFIDFQVSPSNKLKSNNSEDIRFSGGFIKLVKVQNDWLPFTLHIQSDLDFFYESSLQGPNQQRLDSFDTWPQESQLKTLDSLGIGLWFDVNSSTIHLYRDIFGRIPLYYVHLPNEFFAFANSLPALLKMPRIRHLLSIDIVKLTHYSSFSADSSKDYNERTFYYNIKSVLPGHILSIDRNIVQSRSNIQFNLSKWNHISKLNEYGEVFKDLFQKSLSSAISNPSLKLFSHLSGGLDSSSIASMAGLLYPEKKIQTLFGKSSQGMEEIHFAHSVAQQINSVHHDVDTNPDFITMLERHTSWYGHPENMVLGGFFQGSLFEKSAQLGADILLIGHDGDGVVGSGLNYLSELYESRKWTELDQLLLERARHVSFKNRLLNESGASEDAKYEAFKNFFIYGKLTEELAKRGLYSSLMAFLEVNKHLPLSYKYFLNKGVKGISNRLKVRDKHYHSILREDVLSLSKKEILKDQRLTNHSFDEEYKQWTKGIYSVQALTSNEEFYAMGNHYGVSARFPFYDKALYEFSLSVPLSIKFDHGRGRGHFREGMKGILPEELRTRTTKGQFFQYANEVALKSFYQSRDFLTSSNEVWQYVDAKKFKFAVDKLSADKLSPTPNSLLIIKTICLAVWFDKLKSNSFF